MSRIAFALLFVSSLAYGAGFGVSQQGSVQGGTAGAGTAREGDAAAGWFNPAALADDAGWRLQLGLAAALPSLTSSAMDGSWSIGNDASLVTPPHLYASFASGAWAGGIAVGVPFGSGVAWPADWRGRFESVSSSLQDLRIAPFVAWRSGAFRVALGPHVDIVRLSIARRLDFVDAEGDVALDLHGIGVGVDASLFVTAGERVDLGFTYKSRTQVSLSGTARFSSVPPELAGRAHDQNARTELTLPDRLALGARLRAAASFDVYLDLELMLWGTYDALTVTFDDPMTPAAEQRPGWGATLSARAGVEWRPSAPWAVRAGLYLDPSPAPSETLSPSSPDSTRLGFTIGGGRSFGKLRVDAFYEFMALLARESANDDSLAARYGGHAHVFGLGISWQSP